VFRFDIEHDHFTPYCISLQQAESLVKCPLTSEIAQFTPLFTCLHDVVRSIAAVRRRLRSNVSEFEHKRGRTSRLHGLFAEPLYILNALNFKLFILFPISGLIVQHFR